MERLADDLVAEVFSFLWFVDAASLGSASKRFFSLCRTQESIYPSKLAAYAKKINDWDIAPSSINPVDAPLLAKAMAIWPTAIDYRKIPTDIFLNYKNRSAGLQFHYGGEALAEHRSIVADMHFPCISSTETKWALRDPSKALICSDIPFSRIIATPSGTMTLAWSCVAYYEASIKAPPLCLSHRGVAARISIGLCIPNFPLEGLRPGWDQNSCAYYGENGYYHHASAEGEPFGPSFGAGDTIGCGIIYPPLVQKPRLFFTYNGVLVGVLEMNLAFAFRPWFPVLVRTHSRFNIYLNKFNSYYFNISFCQGMDSHEEVSVNFGEAPFAFDVLGYENSLVALGGASPPAMPNPSSGQPFLPLPMETYALQRLYGRAVQARATSGAIPWFLLRSDIDYLNIFYSCRVVRHFGDLETNCSCWLCKHSKIMDAGDAAARLRARAELFSVLLMDNLRHGVSRKAYFDIFRQCSRAFFQTTQDSSTEASASDMSLGSGLYSGTDNSSSLLMS